YDNLAFRHATAFIEVPANQVLAIKMVDKSSPDASLPLYTAVFTLETNKDYVIIAEGIMTFGSETYLPIKDFNLALYQPAADSSSVSSKVELMFAASSTDCPEVDINEITIPYYEIYNNMNYGMKSSYMLLDPDSLVIDLLFTTTFLNYNRYNLDLRPYAGKALSLISSGFINPLVNNNGPSFGLFLSLPQGGALLELPIWEPVGISESSWASELKLYPNPASERVEISGIDEHTQVEVFSAQGITRISLCEGPKFLNLAGFASGVYYVKFTKATSSLVKKLIIDKN
ncbi:MAG: T9SS type A sorting domain-containing protein, partial [Bacteroidales bacterium]|nr:T9SS type A sorting domain-containing protein [Bacteroidales bacterium]